MGRTVKYDHKGREVFNSSWPADMNEDSVEPLCSLCGGLTMIPSDDPDGDIMNTPCPKCNEWSPDFKENPTGQAQP